MACAVCNGSLHLLEDVCPLCDGDPCFGAEEPVAKLMAWEVNIGSWVRYDVETEGLIVDACKAGQSNIEYCARGHQYVVDLVRMQQVNVRTGMSRAIRSVEVQEEAQEAVKAAPPRPQRLTALVEHLLSPAVQLPLPLEATEEPQRLNENEIRQLFQRHVPGVERLLYRDMHGQLAFNFLTVAYASGFSAFRGTTIQSHLLSLFRFTVHQFHDKKISASHYLRDIADAFTDCQAVQARVVERVGLELRGVTADFVGLVTRFVGNYKAMAIKMLAVERIAQRKASDDSNPTHYENRLIADIGDSIGLNKEDVRRASLDEHAASRYPRLSPKERREAASRCRELFDIEAALQAFMAEVSAFDEKSTPESVSRLFLDWASTHMREKHMVFDEATCSRIDMTPQLVLAVFEVLFLGHVQAERNEAYRDCLLRDFFVVGAKSTGSNDEEEKKKAGSEVKAPAKKKNMKRKKGEQQ